ncbi:MAG: toxin-antitoxin system protein [Blastocatellia bacterium]
MQTQTVIISESAHQLLQQLADLEKTSTEVVLDRALEVYRREVFLRQANIAFADLKSDEEAWKEELEERELWDNTIADGTKEQ